MKVEIIAVVEDEGGVWYCPPPEEVDESDFDKITLREPDFSIGRFKNIFAVRLLDGRIFDAWCGWLK